MSNASNSLKPPAERAKALAAEHRGGSAWRVLAREYGVPAGTLCRFAKSRGEYIPRKYVHALGIELPILRPAPVCRQCGQVHVRNKCTMRKPLPEWVTQAATFLQGLDNGSARVYGRGGRKVKS